MLTANEWAQNWMGAMLQADGKMRAGAQRLTYAPGAAAVQAVDKMRANWLAAIDSNQWANATGMVTVEQWRQAYIQKGIPRIADGVRAAQGKVQAYAQRAIPVYTQLQAQINAMPKRTLNDSKARMNAWLDGMVAAKGQLAGAG